MTAENMEGQADQSQTAERHMWISARRVWPYFSHLRSAWAMTILATIAAAATEPLIPAMMQPLLDSGFTRNALQLWKVPLVILALFALRGLCSFVAQVALTKIAGQGLRQLRQDLFAKLMDVRLSLFARQSSSELANKVVYEVQTGSFMLVDSVMSMFRNALTVLALLGYLLYLNWKLTLVVAFLIPGIAIVMRILTKRLYSLVQASQKATDSLAYVVEENVLAHRDVRLHDAQASQTRRFNHLSEVLYRLSIKSAVASSAMAPITQMLSAVALSTVISVALVQSSGNGTTVGGFVSFLTAMLMLVAPIKQLSDVANPITRGLASVERGLDMMQDTPNETQGNHAQGRATGRVEFDSVSVQYPGATEPAVQALSLSIAPGETIALVGASGSGKTSLVNLLPRFVEASAGAVTLDGVDVRQWQLSSLRKQMAYVSQHVVMLNDSIAANIALGQKPDRALVHECLRAANLDSFVTQLPQGLDTLVGHNAMQLSGGQRQRLAIARALYKDAPVLILDEATSALDAESERAIQEALDRLMRNRTTLIIAHRLSTVQHADRIVVMDHGRIAEIGKHQELLSGGGLYARLYNAGFASSGPNAGET